MGDYDCGIGRADGLGLGLGLGGGDMELGTLDGRGRGESVRGGEVFGSCYVLWQRTRPPLFPIPCPRSHSSSTAFHSMLLTHCIPVISISFLSPTEEIVSFFFLFFFCL